MNKIPTTTSQGFTIVEVLVTLFVLTLFITGFFQTFLLLESQRINVVRQSMASDIAYTNLSKYPGKPSNLDCDPAVATTTGTILGSTKDTVVRPYNFSPEPTSNSLGVINQIITAFAPNGCDTSTSPARFKNGIVRIVSTVEFSGNRRVTHVTFVR